MIELLLKAQKDVYLHSITDNCLSITVNFFASLAQLVEQFITNECH